MDEEEVNKNPLNIRKIVNNTDYYCMLLCEALIKKDKINFEKIHRKLGFKATEDNDRKAIAVF
jgi:hypothetical protein